jgi:hypothetical protein
MSCLLRRCAGKSFTKASAGLAQMAAVHLLRDNETVDVVHHVQASARRTRARDMKMHCERRQRLMSRYR